MLLKHQLAALLVTFIWGTNFVLIKIGISEIPPFLFAALRFSMAAFPLVFFLPKPAASWMIIAAYGILIGFGQFGLLFWAMQSDISPGLASLVVQMQVFFTILFAGVFLSEHIKREQLFALLICTLGLVVILLNTDKQTTAFGLFLTLAAAINWAAGNLLAKRAGTVDIIAFIVWSSLFAIPPLWLLTFIFEGYANIVNSLNNASLVAWSTLLWQTIGNTLIGYGLWNALLRRYSAAVATPWSLLVPVFGMAASSIILNEALPLWKITSATLIIMGLIINILVTRKT